MENKTTPTAPSAAEALVERLRAVDHSDYCNMSYFPETRAATGLASICSCDVPLAREAASLIERLQEQVRPTKPCDLFQNGGDGECGGPQFNDPQAEVDLRVCAFHSLMNRNYWMTDARTAHARLDLAMRVVEKARTVRNVWAGPQVTATVNRSRDLNIAINDLDGTLAALDAGTTPE